MNKDVLENDLLLLAQSLYKVIEVDLNEDTFYIIQSDNFYEKNEFFEWVWSFGDTNVHKDDRQRFFEFFNPSRIKEELRRKWMTRVFYRRRAGDGWRFVSAEIVALDNYSEDDAKVLLVIRDIQEYVEDFRSQLGNYCRDYWEKEN